MHLSRHLWHLSALMRLRWRKITLKSCLLTLHAFYCCLMLARAPECKALHSHLNIRLNFIATHVVARGLPGVSCCRSCTASHLSGTIPWQPLKGVYFYCTQWVCARGGSSRAGLTFNLRCVWQLPLRLLEFLWLIYRTLEYRLIQNGCCSKHTQKKTPLNFKCIKLKHISCSWDWSATYTPSTDLDVKLGLSVSKICHQPLDGF